MTSTNRRCFPALAEMALLIVILPLLAAGCGSSGSGATTGGLCTPLQSTACVGPGNCAGMWTCQAKGNSYGPCVCGAATTGGTTGTTGGGTTGGRTTGGTTGGGSSTGAPLQTLFVGVAEIPSGAGLIDITIASTNLGTTPDPGGTVSVSGEWDNGQSITGIYNTASDAFTPTSSAFGASFFGQYDSPSPEVISGHWTGTSNTPQPFAIVSVPTGGQAYAFCGTNGSQTQNLGVAFSTDGTLSGIEYPRPGPGGTPILTGSYSGGLASVSTSDGAESFHFYMDHDGGLSFINESDTWSMLECE